MVTAVVMVIGEAMTLKEALKKVSLEWEDSYVCTEGEGGIPLDKNFSDPPWKILIHM